MENIDLIYFICGLVFLFGIWRPSFWLLSLCINKSFALKIASKEAILKTWFFFMFILAFIYTIYMIKSGVAISVMNINFDQQTVKTAGALIGIVIMLFFIIIPIKYITIQDDITNSGNLVRDQGIIDNDINRSEEERERLNLTSLKISELTSEKKNTSEDNAFDSIILQRETNTFKHFKCSHTQDSVTDEIYIKGKSMELMGKPQARITKQIYYRGADVMPNPLPDEVIKQKLDSIHDRYLFHCETNDFMKLLKREEVTKKVLFKKADGTEVALAKVDYLNFLYFIFGNNLLQHPSNTKIIDWIDKNFDSKNFVGKKIFIKEISDLRDRAKNGSLEI
ncbi:hypothetical protein [Flavobacterium frigidarium]|uniref:hypothetical protein n=1 Tax=Flavobacterium frigidarium TaxID=99286 RepID=UPI0003FEEC83|nr:hypothetical protein [Flavobacterium frigidarium]